MNVDRQNAKLVGSKYRGTYRPSPELSGAVMQALDYRRTLSKNVASAMEDTNHRLSAFTPKWVVVIGNGAMELDDEAKRMDALRNEAHPMALEKCRSLTTPWFFAPSRWQTAANYSTKSRIKGLIRRNALPWAA